MKKIEFDKLSEHQKKLVYFFDERFFKKLSIPEKPVYFWIAGGSILNKIIGWKSDFDLFFRSSDDVEKMKEILLSQGAVITFESELAYHIRWENKDLDLVRRYYQSPEECISIFDFTVVVVAIDNLKNFYHHNDFYEHVAHRSLVINAELPFPLKTMARVQKYNRKGFKICNGGMLKIAKSVAKIDFESKDQNTFEFYPDGSPRFIGVD